MATAVKISNNKWRFFVKGAGEIILSCCDSIVQLEDDLQISPSRDPHSLATLPIVARNGDQFKTG